MLHCWLLTFTHTFLTVCDTSHIHLRTCMSIRYAQTQMHRRSKSERATHTSQTGRVKGREAETRIYIEVTVWKEDDEWILKENERQRCVKRTWRQKDNELHGKILAGESISHKEPTPRFQLLSQCVVNNTAFHPHNTIGKWQHSTTGLCLCVCLCVSRSVCPAAGVMRGWSGTGTSCWVNRHDGMTTLPHWQGQDTQRHTYSTHTKTLFLLFT